jgi:hypothetical protein
VATPVLVSSWKFPARAAILLGLLAVAALPGAVAAAQYLQGVSLLQALYGGVPVAAVLGLAAVFAARRARFARSRSLRQDGTWLVRWARGLAFLGAYAGLTGALALGVYGVLRWAQ